MRPLSTQLPPTHSSQTTQNSEAEAEQLSQEGMQQLNQGQLLAAAHTFKESLKIYKKLDASFSKDTNNSTNKIEAPPSCREADS